MVSKFAYETLTKTLVLNNSSLRKRMSIFLTSKRWRCLSLRNLLRKPTLAYASKFAQTLKTVNLKHFLYEHLFFCKTCLEVWRHLGAILSLLGLAWGHLETIVGPLGNKIACAGKLKLVVGLLGSTIQENNHNFRNTPERSNL